MNMECRGVYDNRLSESVSVAWKSLERAFLQDHQKALLQIQSLKQEVNRLQAELQQTRKDPGVTLQYDQQHESQNPASGTYERLHRIHNLTKIQAGQYKGAFEKCKTRLRQSKAGETYWRRLAEQNGLEVAELRRRIQHPGDGAPSRPASQHLSLSPIFNLEIDAGFGEDGISAPTVVATGSKTLPLPQCNELTAMGKLANSLQESQNSSPIDEDSAVLRNVATSNKKSSSVIQDSSQATLSELGEDFRPLITKPWSDESEEEPTIISSKLVRKRVMSEALDENQAQKAIKLQSGSTDASSEIRIKQEEYDRRSCPTIGVQVSNFVQDEDFDLDEVSGHVDTPKKLLRLKTIPDSEAPRRLGLGSGGRIERSRRRATSMPLQSNLLDPPTGNCFEEQKSEKPQQQQSINQEPDRSYEEPQSAVKRERGEEEMDLLDFSETPGETMLHDILTPRPRSALKSLSTNRAISGLRSELSVKDRKRHGEIDKGIVSIAEDGSKSFWSDCETLRGSKRLQQLLERSNPEPSSLIPNDKTGKQPPQRRRRPQRQTPASECRRSFAEIPLSDEPLRARPLSRLSLDDFRINPLVNQGHSYAFNEVIRGRAQRRACLTGCTLPECCGGQFRKMLQLSTPAAKSKSNPADSTGEKFEARDDLTSEDISLIRAHLERICYSEADAEQKLRSMSARELAETLTDARIYEFAQKHGKHRLPAHRRAQTPPGFWRTSMPDTQELEADRSAAKEMQEKKIQERRREAMRTDGKGLWLFRDE